MTPRLSYKLAFPKSLSAKKTPPESILAIAPVSSFITQAKLHTRSPMFPLLVTLSSCQSLSDIPVRRKIAGNVSSFKPGRHEHHNSSSQFYVPNIGQVNRLDEMQAVRLVLMKGLVNIRRRKGWSDQSIAYMVN